MIVELLLKEQLFLFYVVRTLWLNLLVWCNCRLVVKNIDSQAIRHRK